MPRLFKILAVLFLSCLGVSEVSAQSDYRDQEVSIRNDNDVYLFGNKDRYYTNGITLNYRFEPKMGSFFRRRNTVDSVKFIVDFELSHRTYTPLGLKRSDFASFDRPYAGLAYFGVSLSRFWSPTIRFSYGLEVGVIGEYSGAEFFQKWYHSVLAFPEPLGWEHQIKNEPVLTSKFEFNKQLVIFKGGMDVVSSTNLRLGSAFLDGTQRLDLRFGKIQPLHRSGFKNAILGKWSDYFRNNTYFFVGYGIQYVYHNTLIEGSLWGDESPHTEEVEPWVQHMRAGIAFNAPTSSFKIIYNRLSEEIVDALDHSYISLELIFRIRPKEDR